MLIKGQKLYDFLKDRGLLYQLTNEKEIEELLNGEPTTFYLGIDPTADAIHIGHLCSLRTFRYLQEAGHKGILIIGGATAMIGDPSGRQDMRTVLTAEKCKHNLETIAGFAKKFINMTGDNGAIILNNDDWMKKYSYIDFLRDVGTYFNVNVMLSADAYKKRLASGGLTFLEMGYMPIQAYDFEYLNKKYGCMLEVGGSDQWGNMVAGTELLRKKDGIHANAFTTPLLLNSNGEKMGKSAGGALWVAEDKTSVYDFYQFFINVDDKDTETLLRWFSDFSTKEISDICAGDPRNAKKIMAFEVTKLIHGEENAKQAEKTAKEVFSGLGSSQNMPTIEYSR
ncbi:MAG: tyrosine--tRNA ligase, partial [Clostridia bacterium]